MGWSKTPGLIREGKKVGLVRGPHVAARVIVRSEMLGLGSQTVPVAGESGLLLVGEGGD